MTTITDPLHGIPVRLDLDAAVPAFTKALSHLDTTTTRELDRVGFPTALRELVRLRGARFVYVFQSTPVIANGRTSRRALPSGPYAVSIHARHR